MLVTLLFSSTVRAEKTNGLENCLTPFNVKDCTGPAAGKTLCYYCRYGLRPVVCVFVREMDDETARLIGKIDALVGARRAPRWAAFVVLLGDDTQEAERRLKKLAAEQQIVHTPLTIYRDTEKKLKDDLQVSPAANIVVRWWDQGEIISQREAEGRLTERQIAQIVALLTKRAAE